jgi:lipopolysaccharide/colanic/teichoic acid biosynthesis glycosyltransferase
LPRLIPKRTFDALVAAVGLVVLVPLLVVLAVAVLVSSALPVLFRHVRMGRRGAVFVLLKLRTMTLAPEAERGSVEAGRSQRVAPIGRWVRRTRLDELLQLWNVLRGDMSQVGPRPEVQEWVQAYRERWAFVHTVRPGITDPASIRFRNEEDILAASADPEAT